MTIAALKVEVIHHLLGQGFGVVIFVFKEIFERVDVEERRYRDVAIILAEVAPLHQLSVQSFDVLLSRLVPLEDSA